MNFGQYPFWIYSGSSFGCQAPLYPNMQMQNCTVEHSVKEFEKQLKDRAERINKEKIERMQRQIEELESLVAQQKQNQVLIDALKPTPYPNYVCCGEDPREMFEKNFEEVYELENDSPLWVKIIFFIMLMLMTIGYLVIFFKVGGYGSLTNRIISRTWLGMVLIGLSVKKCRKSNSKGE